MQSAYRSCIVSTGSDVRSSLRDYHRRELIKANPGFVRRHHPCLNTRRLAGLEVDISGIWLKKKKKSTYKVTLDCPRSKALPVLLHTDLNTTEAIKVIRRAVKRKHIGPVDRTHTSENFFESFI